MTSQGTDQPLPSPEEIQRKISEFMKQEFGDRVVFTGTPQAETAETGPPGEESKRKDIEFDFNLKPKDVKAHLDRFVIRQEDAKKALAIAVCDHYNHVKAAEQGEELPRLREAERPARSARRAWARPISSRRLPTSSACRS